MTATIAFLGDSLTEGWPGSSFFALLRDGLLPGPRLRNHGRAGDTVATLASRLRASGLEPVDVAVIWVGVNDAFVAGMDAFAAAGSGDWWRESLSALADAYASLLDWTLARAARVVCVPPVPPEYEDDDSFVARTREIAAVQRELAAERAAARAPLQLFELDGALAAARSAAPDQPLTIDGVHLSARGARVVAEAFAHVLVELTRPTGA